MGNQTYGQETNLWQWISNENGIDIYRHKEDGRLAQKRRISISEAAVQEEMKIYDFRKHNQDGLIKSYQAIVIDNQEKDDKFRNVCSNQHYYVDVYTQRIVNRLSDVPPLTFPESLYVLKTTLSAFQLIYKKNGGIHINQELIGFSQNGEAKVWVNQNWALNNPSHYIPTLKTLTKRQYYQQIAPQYRDESQMISNLYSVIQDKTENGKFPSPFNENLKNKPRNFKQIKKFLKRYVDNQQNNKIPSSINKNKLYSPNNTNQTNSISNHNPLKVGYINQNIISSHQPNRIYQPSTLQPSLNYQTNNIQHSFNYQSTSQQHIGIPSYQSNTHLSRPSLDTHTVMSNYKPIIPSYQSGSSDYNFNKPNLSFKPFQLIATNGNTKFDNFEVSKAKSLTGYLPPLYKKYEYKSFNALNPSEQIITTRLVSPLIDITKEQINVQSPQSRQNDEGVSHQATYKIEGGQVNH